MCVYIHYIYMNSLLIIMGTLTNFGVFEIQVDLGFCKGLSVVP